MADFVLPPHLYMPRKSFEFGVEVVSQASIEGLTSKFLSHIDMQQLTEKQAAMERFWAREHACYIELGRNQGKKYVDYLPGRAYTYGLLMELVMRIWGSPSCKVLEAGCGSALTCSLLATVGANATGIDISQCALNFAQDIATEFGVQINTIRADWLRLPFLPDTFDVVFSLGALEHYPLEVQQAMLLEMARVSRKWIVLLVPNVKSPIYLTMEEQEFATMPLELVYPDENYLYEVNLEQIVQSSGLIVIESSALHIVPPRTIPERYLTSEAYDFFRRVVQQAEANWKGNARATWQAVEAATPMDERERFGWFSYVVCKKL